MPDKKETVSLIVSRAYAFADRSATEYLRMELGETNYHSAVSRLTFAAGFSQIIRAKIFFLSSPRWRVKK